MASCEGGGALHDRVSGVLSICQQGERGGADSQDGFGRGNGCSTARWNWGPNLFQMVQRATKNQWKGTELVGENAHSPSTHFAMRGLGNSFSLRRLRGWDTRY